MTTKKAREKKIVKKVGRPKGLEKIGGREKGTPNRITTDTRQFINDLLEDNKHQISRDLKELEPFQRLTIMLKLMEFCVPKLQRLDMEAGITTKNEILEVTLDLGID